MKNLSTAKKVLCCKSHHHGCYAGCSDGQFDNRNRWIERKVAKVPHACSTWMWSFVLLDNTKNRRCLATEGLIEYALIEAEYLVRGLCLAESDPPCYRCFIHLDIFVSRLVGSEDFSESLMAKYREEPLIEKLRLLPPFVNITFVHIVHTVAQAPSTIPSCKWTTRSDNSSGTIVASTRTFRNGIFLE